MSPEEREDLAKMIHKEFADNPVNNQTQIIEARRPSFAMPTTAGGWVTLFVATGTVIGVISWFIVFFNEIKVHAAKGIFPKAEKDIATLRIADLEFERRISILEEHAHVEGIHQTPAEKKLANIEVMQPIRDDISELSNRVESMEIDLTEIKETLRAMNKRSHE